MVCVCVLLFWCGHVFASHEDIFAGPHNFKQLLEGLDLLLRVSVELFFWVGLHKKQSMITY